MPRRRTRPDPERRGRAGGPATAALLFFLLAAAGCSSNIETSVGDVRGPSINGVSAFVQLLRDSGHTVTARTTLPRRPDRGHRVLIVFDDRFEGPAAESAARLRELVTVPWDMTLVIAFRDADRAIDYYRDMADRKELRTDVRTAATLRLRETREDVRRGQASERPAQPPGLAKLEPCDRADATAVDVTIADRPAAEVVRAAWMPGRRLVPGAEARVLWQSDAEPLLVETDATAGAGFAADPRLRLLELSAAPLLNGGLVDRGNRALAEDLVARLPAGSEVLVVGSTRLPAAGGGQGPREQPSIVRLLRVPPLPWIAAHAVAALALFCWWKAPIFGRPLGTPSTHAQDFGHHVEAFAALLRRSGPPRDGRPDGRQFSEAAVAEWRRRGATAAGQPAPGRGRTRQRREFGDG